MVTHRQAAIETATALVHNPPLLFLAGVIAITIGLAMVLGHNVWTDGAVPVIVTLVGWSTLIKGLLLLFLPPDAAPGVFLGALRYEQLFYVYTAISLLLGSYLTWGAGRQR